MRRFKYLLTSEFKLALTAIPIQVIAIIQPTILFLLMSAILVKPTFDMNIRMNDEPFTKDLVQAMQTIGSPIGETYINPILITDNMEANFQQIIRVENRDDHAVAIQVFWLYRQQPIKELSQSADRSRPDDLEQGPRQYCDRS